MEGYKYTIEEKAKDALKLVKDSMGNADGTLNNFVAPYFEPFI